LKVFWRRFALIVKVGCCGFSVRGGMKAYYERFKLVEVQSTFYKLPRISTVERWRENAPEDFEFTVKCWQVITHSSSSPTWRKAKLKLEGNIQAYGMLKPTLENFDAWEKTRKVCDALRAKVCVVQCPPRFKFSEENISNLKGFFGSIDRSGIEIAWEPRGDWNLHLEEVGRLCEELDLIHVVDVLRRNPAFIGDTLYFRLHGLNPREYDYKYKYRDEDLVRLKDKILGFEEEGVNEVYVLFNNVWMAEDALRFIELLNV